MAQVRDFVTKTLAERASRGIKIRQPLAKLTLAKKKWEDGLYSLLKEELNVKEIVFDPGLRLPAEIDWTITPELKKEGQAREVVRNIQELRKAAGFTPKDIIAVFAQTEGELKDAIGRSMDIIINETKAKKLEFSKPAKAGAEKSIKIDGCELWLGIKKC
jgi:isoleucyl-tRNA synthetase